MNYNVEIHLSYSVPTICLDVYILKLHYSLPLLHQDNTVRLGKKLNNPPKAHQYFLLVSLSLTTPPSLIMMIISLSLSF